MKYIAQLVMRYHRILFIIGITIVCYTHLFAQENPVENYLQQVGNYADIYNGKIETYYNILLYENLPYYRSPDFTEATVIYRKNYYPNQKVRLDLFREQLLLLAPEKQIGIILNSSNVEKVIMYGKTFLWLNPAKESGLKQGYYIHLLEGKKMQLFCKESYILQQNPLVYGDRNIKFYRFDHNARYYLLYDGLYYMVKNDGSFSKLFPQYKKQIKQFTKERKLNFKKENRDTSFVSLTGYCEELITSTNKQ